MKALWHIGPSQSELRNIATEQKRGLHLRSSFSMISTGTERLVASGKVTSQFMNHMAVPYMEGDFDLPIKYGYSLIAEDAAGNPYHVLHPHQSHVVVEATDAHSLPIDLPLPRAALISNMETVINAIWDGHPKPGEQVAICGFGNIGALLAVTLRVHHGIDPVIIEVDAWRRTKAQAMGFDIHKDHKYDVLYHTTANAVGLQWCIDHAHREGRIVELSWYGDRSIDVHLGSNFHYDRLRLISSQVSSIPRHMEDQYDYKKRKDLAIQLLKNDQYDTIITDIIPFIDAPKFFDNLRKGDQGNGLIWLLEY